MSILYRRIHGVFFATSRHSSRIPFLSAHTSASTALPPYKKDMRVPDRELFKERNLRKIVEMFMSKCDDSAYRHKGYVTYVEIVRRLALSKQLLWIEEVLEDQKKYCVCNPAFAERFIELYGKAGMFEHALKVFDEMPQLNCKRTVRTFNMLLYACVQSEKYDEFERILRDIPAELSITPDAVSYNIAMKVYSRMGSVDNFLRIVDEMKRRGLKLDSTTYDSLLVALYQNAGIPEAKVDSTCSKRYTTKIMHLVAGKRLTEAVKLLEELKSFDITPDKCVFSALFKGFREEGNLDEAKKLYEKMKINKCFMDQFIYGILVRFASEMGDFEFARMLCLTSIKESFFLGQATLQQVVNGLIGQSKVEEAEELVVSIQASNNPRFSSGLS